MGLIQSVIEKAGVPTVSVSVLREITEKVQPPRVLFHDGELGYPLAAANDAGRQKRVIRAMLALLAESVPPGVSAEHSESPT